MKPPLIVEHSEPGHVISLSDDLEHTLRHLSWERVLELREELLALAGALSCRGALEIFHVETPGEAGAIPPSLATLEPVDEKAVRRVLAAAATEKGYSFSLHTSVLLEGRAQTRRDYVEDLKLALTAVGYDCYGPQLPERLRRHRRQLLEKEFASLYPPSRPGPGVLVVYGAVHMGHRWVKEQAEKWRKALEKVDAAVTAVGRYLLGELSPEQMSPEELTDWCLVAALVDAEHLPHFYEALESRLTYLHEKIRYAYEIHRQASVGRTYLENRMRAYLTEARGIYTPEAVAALEALTEDMDPFRVLKKVWEESAGDEGSLG
ncbi:MAG: hypothetical protein ACUVTQ_01910 [Desulfotomaculales bacterium]